MEQSYLRILWKWGISIILTVSINIFGGKILYNVKIGTMKWKWWDDQGKEFNFRIPNSNYVSDRKIRLISPEQWEKHQNDHKTHISGKTMVHASWKLSWDIRKYSLHKFTTFYQAAIYINVDLFCQKSEINYNGSMENTVFKEVATISDDDNDIAKPTPKQTGIIHIWS